MPEPKIGILMGSDSDFGVMEASVDVLERFGVAYEILVASAHRSPQRVAEYAGSARERGLAAILVGAGAAAHLGGVVAAHTTLPVIGVPIDATALRGVDALYATVMMPGGIPVASMAIGKAGATNAALFTVSMLSTHDEAMALKLARYRDEMARRVGEKSAALQEKLAARGGA